MPEVCLKDSPYLKINPLSVISPTPGVSCHRETIFFVAFYRSNHDVHTIIKAQAKLSVDYNFIVSFCSDKMPFFRCNLLYIPLHKNVAEVCRAGLDFTWSALEFDPVCLADPASLNHAYSSLPWQIGGFGQEKPLLCFTNIYPGRMMWSTAVFYIHRM